MSSKEEAKIAGIIPGFISRTALLSPNTTKRKYFSMQKAGNYVL